MLKKAAAFLFDIRKLANYICFFGYLALCLAAITGMSWEYCRPELKKQKRRASGGGTDTCAAQKRAGK